MQPAVESRLSRCPRCGGNIGLEYDPPIGWDVVCLQCGFRRPRVAGRGPARPGDTIVYRRVPGRAA